MPACARCGQAGHDFSRLTDDQLDRALDLLRPLVERECPALASVCGSEAHLSHGE